MIDLIKSWSSVLKTDQRDWKRMNSLLQSLAARSSTSFCAVCYWPVPESSLPLSYQRHFGNAKRWALKTCIGPRGTAHGSSIQTGEEAFRKIACSHLRAFQKPWYRACLLEKDIETLFPSFAFISWLSQILSLLSLTAESSTQSFMGLGSPGKLEREVLHHEVSRRAERFDFCPNSFSQPMFWLLEAFPV